jgi:RND family efflux transporter MFP subunit
VTRRRIVWIAGALGIVALVWWRIESDASKMPARPAPPPLQTLQARVGAAPVELVAMGQVVSPHSVAVRPQVSGAITEIYFTEGGDVAAGDKLFLIDPAPYRAALAQAQAQLARDKAALAAARSQYERLKPLEQKEYASAQEIENARTVAAQARALVDADEAALTQAQINVDRTLVKSPIAGRTGSISVQIGNVVGPSDAAPVVVINQLQPVQIEFSVPQSALASVQEALARGAVPVRVTAEQPGQVLGEGQLIFVDNSVNATTGTVRLKAEVTNRDLRLWPGAFVTAVLTLQVEPQAVLLPEGAVQPGAAGPFVFVVDSAGVVSLRNVVVARQVGTDVVIADGLKPGENVVARPPRNLAPGDNIDGKRPGKGKSKDQSR